MTSRFPKSALSAAGLYLSVFALLAADPPATVRPLRTRTDDVKETFGSVQIADPYRWLEDQDAPETRAWIDEQNKYSEALLRSFPGRDMIQKRVTELLKIDSIGVPQERGGRYFFTRRRADQDLPVLYAGARAARTRSSSIRIRSPPITGRPSRSWT